MTTQVSTPSEPSVAVTAWSPLREPLFFMLWVATLASNIGTWMHDVGAGWLMTSLSGSAVMVAVVQTATSLPIFLLALPAGTLSDIVDRRKYLIAIQCWLGAVAVLLAIFAFFGVITPWILVSLTFAMGLGTALMMPAWAAITPEVVSREQLSSAIALNSLGINIARAIGPALAGVLISTLGTEAVFALNALSYLGVIYVLWRWQRKTKTTALPAERFLAGMRTGLRFAWHAPELQSAVIRGTAFFLFASASWALLPLVARSLPESGPHTFGILVACLGVGAVIGAVLLPKVRERLTRDVLVASATALYALAMLGLSLFSELLPLIAMMVLAGAAWIAVLSSLQVTAQMSLPNWVRSRGLAVFMAAFMGSMAFGSLLWGNVAEQSSIQIALQVAALGLILAIALTWRFKIAGVEAVDRSPAMHWPAPVVEGELDRERGPVLITLRYQVVPDQRQPFLSLMQELGRRRRRDGAFSWGIYQDTEDARIFIETFYVESWLEHLRQHERVTEDDRVLQGRIRELLQHQQAPQVGHFVAPY